MLGVVFWDLVPLFSEPQGKPVGTPEAFQGVRFLNKLTHPSLSASGKRGSGLPEQRKGDGM